MLQRRSCNAQMCRVASRWGRLGGELVINQSVSVAATTLGSGAHCSVLSQGQVTALNRRHNIYAQMRTMVGRGGRVRHYSAVAATIHRCNSDVYMCTLVVSSGRVGVAAGTVWYNV
jgi:hypothetical protein